MNYKETIILIIDIISSARVGCLFKKYAMRYIYHEIIKRQYVFGSKKIYMNKLFKYSYMNVLKIKAKFIYKSDLMRFYCYQMYLETILCNFIKNSTKLVLNYYIIN
jgi:hypothetical protein